MIPASNCASLAHSVSVLELSVEAMGDIEALVGIFNQLGMGYQTDEGRRL